MNTAIGLIILAVAILWWVGRKEQNGGGSGGSGSVGSGGAGKLK